MTFLEQLLDAADNFFQGKVRNEELAIRLKDDLERRKREEEDRRHELWRREQEKKIAAEGERIRRIEDIEKILGEYQETKSREKIGDLSSRIFAMQGRVKGASWSERLKQLGKKPEELKAIYRLLFGKQGEKFIDDLFKGDILSQISSPADREKVVQLFRYLYGDRAQEELESLYGAEREFRLYRESVLKDVDEFVRNAELELIQQLQAQGYNLNDPRIQMMIRNRVQQIRDRIGAWAMSQFRAMAETKNLMEPLSLFNTPTNPFQSPQGGGSR